MSSELENTVRLKQLLEFEVVFPEEKMLNLEQYLECSNREIILKSAAFFLGFKSSNSMFNDNRIFIETFFGAENKEIANHIYNKIEEIEKKGARVGIINTYSSLKLFEYIFSKPSEQKLQKDNELEVNLFKAYLALNSEFTKRQKTAFKSTKEIDKNLKMPLMTFCMHYPVSDKTNYDIKQIWITQIIKAIYLFKFLESQQKTQPLLDIFLAQFNCSSWQEYLRILLPLTTPAVKKSIEAHTDIVVKEGNRFEEGCGFIEKLMIQELDELDPNDFLTLRAKPFYKIKDGVYRIIFDLFVVEKIFKGVYFQLRDINKTLPTSERIKDIKSFFGSEFSENILLYNVMESIYPDKCIRFTGKELLDMRINAAPDYYLRIGNNIIIIESKDFLIAAHKKMSFDFGIYEEEFGRILDYEEMNDRKIKPKAILQLIKNIRNILKNEFIFDSKYNYKKVFIYPILMTHDHQYDTPGFNEMIDYWFQDALLDLLEEKLYIHNIKPLSVVNIDSLIYNQVGLANNIKLHEILNLYHQNKKFDLPKKQNFRSQEELDNFNNQYSKIQMTKLAPFSLFIDNHFNRSGLRKPPALLEVIPNELFSEENEVNDGYEF